MANFEHLAILEQGVEVWNKWREENYNIHPDLNDVNLSGRNLNRYMLRDVNLYKADMSGADLSETNLALANLSAADLFSADLSSALLISTDLYGTNLNNAKISDADVSSAIAGFTSFGGVDLSSTKGLEDVEHEAPSTIGIDTLYLSQGNIPEIFLRGCGVPDQMIEYARWLTSLPIQYCSCFISYSHKEEELAQRIHNDLQAAVVRCWFAPHNLKIGDKIRTVIDESIRLHDKLLFILSEHSVQSNWVEHEVEHALDREKIEKKNILFPVRLDESVMDSTTGWAGNIRRQRHI